MEQEPVGLGTILFTLILKYEGYNTQEEVDSLSDKELDDIMKKNEPLLHIIVEIMNKVAKKEVQGVMTREMALVLTFQDVYNCVVDPDTLEITKL